MSGPFRWRTHRGLNVLSGWDTGLIVRNRTLFNTCLGKVIHHKSLLWEVGDAEFMAGLRAENLFTGGTIV